ncbi:hypothetical protein [Salinibacter grassmerensis]|uniref:hypothetical protein n=1 Tax=Salinibacter grassmerensis TaxID=3040353 RepID=UPI0021E73228|nr:hypothetical protein [Salinibacter grassmerensis]
MNDRLPSLPIEARERNPYRSLYAALLLQNVQDAINDALSDGDSQDPGDGGVPPRPHLRPSGTSFTAVTQA